MADFGNFSLMDLISPVKEVTPNIDLSQGLVNPFQGKALTEGVMSAVDTAQPLSRFTTPDTGFDFGGLLDTLSKNKDVMTTAGSLLGTAGKLYSAREQADYAKGLLDLQRENIARQEEERQRQIGKEESAIANLESAYSQAFSPKKKKTSSYYGV